MQVDCYHTIRSCYGKQVGHQFRGDRLAALRLLLLPGIAIVGHNDSDAIGRGATKRINHHQQFHKMFVHRGAGRLHDIDISTSHAFLDLDVAFSIGKMIHFASSQWAPEPLCNESCHFGRGRATVDINVRNCFVFTHVLYCCCFRHNMPSYRRIQFHFFLANSIKREGKRCHDLKAGLRLERGSEGSLLPDKQ